MWGVWGVRLLPHPPTLPTPPTPLGFLTSEKSRPDVLVKAIADLIEPS
ncbi:hypothetical protein [Nostoc sp. 'Peltigera membranacea cyanobiont' 210A]|nr:hypothetical protein [Nostoc sp. 'Peltigera membranacea cyanobiont' 210A]